MRERHVIGISIFFAILCLAAGFTKTYNVKVRNSFNWCPNEVWLSSTVADGLGLGTQGDPIDCHTQPLFDAALAAIPANSHIHLLPGTFQISPHNEVSPTNVKSNWIIEGSGMNKTIVQMVGSIAGSSHYAAFTSPSIASTDNVTISDLTVDCNWPGLALTADTGATVRSVSDGVTNGTATVTSSTIALTANDLHSVVTGSADIPSNAFIGVINSSTSFGLSSSPTSNVPVNATGSHTSQTITLKEKNAKTGAIGIYGTNNTIRRVRSTNSYGSNANSQEQFAQLLGASSTGPDAFNNTIQDCLADTPWGNYGSPYALFGGGTFYTRNARITGSRAYGTNNGLNAGFTTGGVNLSNTIGVSIDSDSFTDCGNGAYFDTGIVNGVFVNNLTTVRGGGGVSMQANDPTSTVTITINSPAVVTWNTNGLYNGQVVRFTTTGSLPTGLTVGLVYYVIAATTNTFEVAATPDGSAINTSGSQLGTHTATAAAQQNVTVVNSHIEIQNRSASGAAAGISSGNGAVVNLVLLNNILSVAPGGLGGATIFPLFGNTINHNVIGNTFPNGYTSGGTFNGINLNNRTPTLVPAPGLFDNFEPAATSVIFANRPASPYEGQTQAFSDSSTNTWGATITGLGLNHVKGYYDGTNWTVMAK